MKSLFVTLFDKKYFIKGVAMVDSLLLYSHDHEILILALDKVSYSKLTEYYDLNNRVIVKNTEYIGKELNKQIIESRTYREYCWALSSILSYTALNKQNLDVIYLDADIYFFNSIESLLNQCRSECVAITPHRFSEKYKFLEINGRYNVQWVYFKNNESGQLVAQEWMEDCILSTSYDANSGIVGDQKYLDKWPEKYKNILEIDDLGAGLAPWNQENVSLSKSGNSILIDDEFTLRFYHFHSFKIFGNKYVLPVSSFYKLDDPIIELVYKPYISKLNSLLNNNCAKTDLILAGPKFSLFLNFLQVVAIRATQSKLWKLLRFLNFS